MRNKRSLCMGIKQISEAGSFEGVLATYGNIDLGHDIIEVGAFSKTIAEHGPTCKLLWQHEPSSVIGTLLLIDGPDALRVKGQIELDDNIPFSKTAHTLLKKKLLSGLSIGYDVVKDEMKNGVRYLKELRLWEGSLVTFPMNEMATVTSVKARAKAVKDGFADEYNENVVMAAPFQMLDALTESLFDLLYAGGLSSDELTQAATLALQEFQDAWLEWLPLYLGLTAGDGGMDTMSRRALELKLKAICIERKEGRRYSAATKSMMKDCHSSIKNADSIMHALLDPAAVDDEEEDDSEDDTPAAKAARAKPEPVPDHSAALDLVTSIRTLIPTANGSGK